MDVSVGIRMDGTIDIDLREEGSEWSLNNMGILEAEFLYEELGHAINKQKSRKINTPIVLSKKEVTFEEQK